MASSPGPSRPTRSVPRSTRRKPRARPARSASSCSGCPATGTSTCPPTRRTCRGRSRTSSSRRPTWRPLWRVCRTRPQSPDLKLEPGCSDDQVVKGKADHRRLRVLVADDAPDVRNLVAAHLKRGGHKVLLAEDGPQALEIAVAEKPDLAIVDIMMPGMNGYQLTEKLRETPVTEELPIIVLTARAGGADRAHALRVGADAYVQKRFELQRLTDEIASVMMLADAV